MTRRRLQRRARAEAAGSGLRTACKTMGRPTVVLLVHWDLPIPGGWGCGLSSKKRGENVLNFFSLSTPAPVDFKFVNCKFGLTVLLATRYE